MLRVFSYEGDAAPMAANAPQKPVVCLRTMSRLLKGWSRGTMWPASLTLRNVKLLADLKVPASPPALVVHVVLGAALKASAPLQSSWDAHARFPCGWRGHIYWIVWSTTKK